MRIVPVDRDRPAANIISTAAELLKRGRLVAFPTETVYGLGAHALDPDAVGRIFAAKGRPSFNPLIVHVSGPDAARALATEWPERAKRLAEAFWPGPLTLVLPKRDVVPDVVTAGLTSVALRMPSHPVALALLRAAKIPLAAPSANRSTAISPTTAEHVAKSLGDRVDLILDAGPTHLGIESTVVDLTADPAVLLRPGAISRERLTALIGPVAEPAPASDGAPRASPGMMQRHYAPRARVQIVSEADAEQALSAIAEARARRQRVGALVYEPTTLEADHTISLPADPEGYARELYAALHALDDAGCAVILVQRLPDDSAWDAPRDRLARAAR